VFLVWVCGNQNHWHLISPGPQRFLQLKPALSRQFQVSDQACRLCDHGRLEEPFCRCESGGGVAKGLDKLAKAVAGEKEAAARRATDVQVLEDAERLIAAWNERQAKRMPMLFSPTIGAAITAGYWFLWVRCPACRTTNAIDLRTLDRHRDAAVTSLIPSLSCRSCRPNAPFAELVRLSRTSIADNLVFSAFQGAAEICRPAL
jgi:hypothetical protein